MAGRIWLVRHGESIWNAECRITGSSDPPLSERGRQQADRLAVWGCALKLDAIVATPLQRTQATATPLAEALGLRLQIEPSWREISFGAFEGRFRDERDPEALAHWERWRHSLGADPLPGGESFDQLSARAVLALDHWQQLDPDRSLLIVGHRNVNRALLAHRLGWDRARAFAQRISSRTVWELDRGEPALVALHRLTS